MKIAYIKLYSTWQGRRVLIGTRHTAEEATEYVANTIGVVAVPVYCRTQNK